MSRLKTSVIIPVYNTERYLRKCLESVLNQSQKEIEIIAIDDGSTDGSPAILQEFQNKYHNISVFSQPNMRQGAARNAGLKHAKGEYIYFLDSDDYLDSDTLETCYNQAKEYHLDAVLFDAKVTVEGKMSNGFVADSFDRRNIVKDADHIYTGKEFLEKYMHTVPDTVSVCLMYISRAFSEQHELKFLEKVYYEDEEYRFKLMLAAKRVKYIPRLMYNRRYRENSTMTTGYTPLKIGDFAFVLEEMLRDAVCYQQGTETVAREYLEVKIAGMVNLCKKVVFEKKDAEIISAMFCLMEHFGEAFYGGEKGLLENFEAYRVLKEMFGRKEMEGGSMQPLVSIIIPVYNGSNFLRQAINSALAQTYENVEVIIVNDGSNDAGETERIALSYGKRIRYITKENGGVASALNLGISVMRGTYFSWLSHDDMYAPNKIEEEVRLIDGKDDRIACCNVSVVSESGQVIRNNYISERKYKSISCFMALDTDTGINGCALLVPRIAFEECGYFKEELKCVQDYDMWIRLTRKYKFIFSEKQLVLSRQHPAQDSKTKPVLCTREADALHSRILKNISIDEFENFEEDLSYFKNQYHVYSNAGYKKTAAQILAKLLWLYRKKNKQYCYRNLFQNEVLMLEDDGLVDNAVNQIDAVIKGEKPTLLFYNNVWAKGGIERSLSIVMPLLLKEYNVILVHAHIEGENGFELPAEIPHIKIGNKMEERVPFRLLVLSIMLKVDLFIGNANIIPSFLDVYSLMEESGIRTIACNHGNYFVSCWAKTMYPLMAKRREVYPHVSAVTWMTSFSQYLGKAISENSVLLPNPNTYEKQAALEKENKEKIVICVGRFKDSIKRLDRVLKVFRKLLDKQPDAKLIIIGSYDLDMRIPEDSIPIRVLIEQLGLSNTGSIEWLGEVDNVEQYYKKASLQILTSDSEGFGMVVNEGGIFGCPSVIFEIPGLEDLIEDGKNGYILPQGDIDGMADKISDLLNNTELLMAVQRNAMTYAERFDKKNVFEKWRHLISCVLQTPPQADLVDKLQFGAAYPPRCEERLFYSAVQAYQKEIQRVSKDIERAGIHLDKGRVLKDAEELKEKYEEYTHREILEFYENSLIHVMELGSDEKNWIRYLLLSALPLDKEGLMVGIYGTGVHTRKMLNSYEQLIGKVKATLVFIDTKKPSLTEKYMGSDIYNIKDIGSLPLQDIVLSSILYEDEMYKMVKELYGERYKIYRFYEKSKQRLFD